MLKKLLRLLGGSDRFRQGEELPYKKASKFAKPLLPCIFALNFVSLNYWFDDKDIS